MLEILFARCGAQVLREEYLSQVSERRRARVDALVKPEDKAAALTAELLLKKLLEEQDLPLDYVVDEYGKPQLDPSTGLHIGLSHCDGMAAAALSDLPVGVDVERLRDVKTKANLRVFSIEENEYLAGLTGKQREIEFLRLWVCRESYAKALGKGLQAAIGDPISFIHTPCTVNGVTVYRPQAPDDYIAAIAIVGNSEIARIRTVTYE